MTPTILRPRPYQEDAIAAILAGWQRGVQRGAVVHATGLGKTVVMCHLIARAAFGSGQRVAVIVHRDTLVKQTVRKLHSIAPHLSVGVVKAERRELDADVVVISVQTIARQARLHEIPADYFQFLIIDECFPAGTMVGDRSIESLKSGDMVPSWDETTGQPVMGRVVQLMKRRPSGMVRVTMADGTSVCCTPEHPFMTRSGWVPARLLHGECVLSFPHDDTTSHPMHGVRNPHRADTESTDRRAQRQGARVLLRRLSRRLGIPELIREDGSDESKTRFGAYDPEQSDEQSRVSGQDVSNLAADKAQATVPGWQRTSDSGRSPVARRFSWLADRGSRRPERRRTAVSLQGGYSSPNNEGVRRSGRRVSLRDSTEGSGCQAGRAPQFHRVVDVSILESGSDGTYGGVCSDGFVYNIEVDTTHTYMIGNGVVVHNCHHSSAESYVRALRYFGCYTEGGPKVVGFTATLVRADKRGLGSVFTEVFHSLDILWGIRNGFLVEPRAQTVTVDALDLDRDVTRVGGDYGQGSLGREMVRANAPAVFARWVADHAMDRQGIAFWPTVDAAYAFQFECQCLGIKCAVVEQNIPYAERDVIHAAIESGPIQVISNVMTETEGLDIPQLSFVIDGSPSSNVGLMIQKIGRGLRPHRTFNPDSPYPWMRKPKTDCLVVRLEGATTLKLASLVDLSDVVIRSVKDGETLSEAIDRETAEDEATKARIRKVTVTDADLFAKSSSDWLQTKRGYWFLPTQDWLIALYPEDSSFTSFMVGKTWNGKGRARKGEKVWGGMTLDYGMAMAESLAGELDPVGTLASRTASWKTRKAPATDAQLSFARGLGIKVPDGCTKVELSHLMTTVIGTRKLDRYIPPAPTEEN